MWKVGPVGGRRLSDVLAGKAVLSQDDVTRMLDAEGWAHRVSRTTERE